MKQMRDLVQIAQQYTSELNNRLGSGEVTVTDVFIENTIRKVSEPLANSIMACAIPHIFEFHMFEDMKIPNVIGSKEKLFEKLGTYNSIVKPSRMHIPDTQANFVYRDQMKSGIYSRAFGMNEKFFVDTHYVCLEYYEKLIKKMGENPFDLRLFSGFSKNPTALNLGDLQREFLFHLIPVDEKEGFSFFEKIYRTLHTYRQFAHLQKTLDYADEQHFLLKSPRQNWLSYYGAVLLNTFHRHDEVLKNINKLKKREVSPELLLDVSNLEGLSHYALKNYDKAIEIYESLLAKQSTYNLTQAQIADFSRNLADVYREKRMSAKAIEVYNISISASSQENDFRRAAFTAIRLGNLYYKLEAYDFAKKQFDLAIAYLQKAGLEFELADVYNGLGNIYTNLSNWNLAHEFYQKAINIKNKFKDNYGQAVLLLNMANMTQRLEKYEVAIEYANQAISIFEGIGDALKLALGYKELARIYQRTNRLSEAEVCIRKAIASIEYTGTSDLLEYQAILNGIEKEQRIQSRPAVLRFLYKNAKRFGCLAMGSVFLIFCLGMLILGIIFWALTFIRN